MTASELIVPLVMAVLMRFTAADARLELTPVAGAASKRASSWRLASAADPRHWFESNVDVLPPS
jgi:hypothetical protein